MAPAWMAELSEEWVEPVEDEERVQDGEDDTKQESEVNRLDFGSLVIEDRPVVSPSQASLDGGGAFGTTVFRAIDGDEEQQEQSYQMGSILFSPSKKRTTSTSSTPGSPNAAPSPSQQLAMAAAAFNNDLLHQRNDSCIVDESNPPTSIHIKAAPAKRLQSLFMQPSSASLPTQKAITQNRSSIQEDEEQQGQATRYEEYEDDSHQGSFIVDQQLEDIPDPSLPEESLEPPSMRDVVDISNANNAKDNGEQPPNNDLNALNEASQVEQEIGAQNPDNEPRNVVEASQVEPSCAAKPAVSIVDNVQQDQTKTQSMLLALPPSTEFSFRMEPKSPPQLLSSYLEGVFTTPSQGQEEEEALQESLGIATSTPSTSRLVNNRQASTSTASSQIDTPSPRKENQQIAKPSPALSIFKFQQDTYTRQHFQALVAEIDGLTSPPRNYNSDSSYAALDISDSQFGATTGDMLAASRRGMYKQSTADEYNNPSTQTFEYSYHTAHIGPEDQEQVQSGSSPYQHILDLEEDDENGRIANTRSSKRVRLSASEYRPHQYQQQQQQHQQHQSQSHSSIQPNFLSKSAILSPFRTRIQNRVMPRTTTPIRRRTQRQPFSASSRLQYSQRAEDLSIDASGQSSPARPPLRSLPPMTAPGRRTYHSSMLQGQGSYERMQDGEDEAEAETVPVETPPNRWRRTETATISQEHGKTPAHVVQDRLHEAKALMERIRQRNFQRQGSSSSATSHLLLQGSAAAVLVPGSDKSPVIAVTPDYTDAYIGNSAYKRRPVTRQNTLSRPANPTPSAAALAHQMAGGQAVLRGMAPTPEDEEGSTRSMHRDSNTVGDISVPEEERLDSLAPLPTINTQTHNNTTASIRRQLSSSPVVQQVLDSPAQGHPSSSSRKRTFTTVPQKQLQAPRYPAPSSTSHTSSDRFFTSTSSRYVSGSTAPTSLVASSIGTAKGYHHEHRHGIVNITPAEAENLLTEDVLGDMVFDDVHKRWVKIDKYLASRAGEQHRQESLISPAKTGLPALSPVEEMSGRDEENTADDPFRDITGLESSKSRSNDLTGNSSGRIGHLQQPQQQKHNRSGSLVLPSSASQASAARSEEDDRQTEKTSTPPHNVSVAMPFVSPDLPSIAQASSSSQLADSRPSTTVPPQQHLSTSLSSSGETQNVIRRLSSGNSIAPKSVLKRSDTNAYSTPLPSSKLISRIASKQTRSVSFSDGKLPGRGDSLDAQQARIASSALRNEIKHNSISQDDSASHGEDTTRIEKEVEEDNDEDTISLDAYTSTVNRADNHQSHYQEHSRNASLRQMEHDTPTASYNSYAKPRSLRLKTQRSASLANSMVSTTSTLAWHRKPLNANATILTECSFGVSYDRLLTVLTDVVPFEPSWKDLEHINLRERGLESVVRLKEFLPNLDEINLSDNNIAFLTGLPSSLRFLSLTNNRLGDLSSFTYLKNLESLDISGNTGVTSVRQLAYLHHLRILKADGCGIDSIEGIDQLDGLITLSLCNNSLDQIRLENTAWTRLETLEISDNNILEVSGIEMLPSLRTLNLDFNRLQDLSLAAPSPSLRILKISNNSLESLDLAQMPNVRTVFADYNRITNLSGTSRLRKLENLSLREQRQGTIDFPVKDLRDIRRLYLSYNPIPEAFPNEHFLNLTLLELSGCRLTSLPTNFAAVVPNCRVLILDNNFLTTLAPVAGAKRLRIISAVGNRLEKVKDLLAIWLECSDELEVLDLRLNPMTLGFYASPNLSVAPPNLNLLPSEENINSKAYKALDAQHRHTLPNEWLARRTAYRSLMIEAVPCLKLLDGLKVGRTHRQRARELVDRFAC